MPPPLTVLVPAYQAEGFIQKTLDSLSTQTFGDFVGLVSVDRCSDRTLAICQEHAVRDSRFTVTQTPERLGWVGNSNCLLEVAKTPYAVFAFHDDILAPRYFEALVGALERNPEAVMAFSDVVLTNVDGTQEKWVYTALEGMGDPIARGFSVFSREGQWWVPNRGIFRMRLAQQIGGLKLHDSGEFSADLPWLFHLSLLGSFLRVPETLCFKYYRASSLSRSWAFTQQQHHDCLVSCMRELWNARVSSLVKQVVTARALPLLLQSNGNPSNLKGARG